MKVLCYSARDFERHALRTANGEKHELHFSAVALSLDTVPLAHGFDAICIFAGDDASGPVLEALKATGVRFLAIRAAGYDNVAIETVHRLGMQVANVPAYSPYAVAEHAVALLMALNRKIILADRQVHRNDFRVDDLFGFDLHGKTVGIIGTGRIGSVAARIFHGFGCTLLGYDIKKDKQLAEKYRLVYTDLADLCALADIITIHTCLTPETKYLINSSNIRLMKKCAVLINTSRGAVVNTADVIAALEQGRLGAFGTDVYEREKGVFFYDRSEEEIKDPILMKLLQLPNVLVTPHQAFATKEALRNIAETTIENLDHWAAEKASPNEINVEQDRPVTPA